MSAGVRLLRGVTAVVLGVGLAVGGATAASAHAELVRTDPKVGQTLKQAPGDITFTFSEPMIALGAVVQVVGRSGAVEKGRPSVSGRTVTQPLDAGVDNGSYIVTWRLTSDDGHVQGGTFTFLVADPSRPQSTAGAGTPPADQEPPPPAATTTAAAGPTSSAVPSTMGPMAGMDHDDGDSLPLGWVIAGVVVLAAVIAGAVITEVRRRRRPSGAGPRGPSTG